MFKVHYNAQLFTIRMVIVTWGMRRLFELGTRAQFYFSL
jgi:hypothetical protein